ncbi:MAG: helix-turn-helix domain-containing protein [Myxococcaceae bacterium]|nr:helix-turn-helix domain-containing protein [Myxococcaceae bacterium]
MKPELPKNDEPRWTVKIVAAFLNCSPSKVYKASEAGTLPCVRLDGMLRFNPDEIRAYARGELKPRPRVRLVHLDVEKPVDRG